MKLTASVVFSFVSLVSLNAAAQAGEYDRGLAQGACARFVRNHPQAEWQLSGCKDNSHMPRLSYNACNMLNEALLFGGNSRAMFNGVVWYRLATCNKVPKVLAPTDKP